MDTAAPRVKLRVESKLFGKPMRYLKHLFSAIGLALVLVTAAQAETITPHQAAQFVGYSVTVEGVVSQVSKSRGGTTFINFGGRYPNHVFYGVIFKNSAGRFPGVHGLEGRVVAISGKVKLYKGKPQIILSSSGQIELRK